MAASQITVSSAKLWYGTAAEIAQIANTPDGNAVGDVAWAHDTNTEYTCEVAGTTAGTATWTITRLNNTAGAAAVYLQTLLAGEDQTNDVIKVESQFGYEVVDWGAISADEIIGSTGAIGDLLQRLTITEAPAGANVNLYDGTVAGGDLVMTIAASTAVGTTFELGCVSVNGGWTFDYDASASAGIFVCIGRFT